MTNMLDKQIEKYLEVHKTDGEGFQPLVDFGSWRVATLRYLDSLRPENITELECHLETDEVFILLEGQCTLLIGIEENDAFKRIESIPMEPLKLYNIPKGVYHSHTLTRDATVLIVENQDTSPANSHKIQLTALERERMANLKFPNRGD